MKLIIFISTAFLFVLIVGCAPNPPPTIPQSTSINSSSTLASTSTNVPSTSPSLLPTVTNSSSDWEASKNCVTEYPIRSESNQPKGVAVLRSLDNTTLDLSISLLNLQDGMSHNINTSNQSVWEADASPDRQTLAYKWFNNSSSKWELILVDATGETQSVPWSSDKDFSFQGWLNDHQLVIGQDLKYFVVDPYQDQQKIISPSDFPGFDLFNSRFFVAFDPSLSEAIYKNGQIILLDLSTNMIIARIKDGYDRVPITSWRPSGEQVAVVTTISTDANSSDLSDEILAVNNNGQIRQITHLYDTFKLVLTIESLSWSPDGNRIAFWLHDDQGNLTLMVADYATGKTVNYCILNVTTTSFPINVPAPIWSPDGMYLMVENRYAADKNKILMVDLSNKVAFPIAENANPVGWMAAP